ncbi:hypothetical protein STIAU_6255 [Stigmatella aurantiaca DW4/3-1]|uniref:Uncharacterized protein n=1 Tax=Stigmatella aurantiaca (strain DW4/3-1) TaxID=378806 RepID=Q08T71_STIAD|nr:hypothetical protein STIAU_6255 [Stigmatella aurantiaca DW4/3-1]
MHCFGSFIIGIRGPNSLFSALILQRESEQTG